MNRVRIWVRHLAIAKRLLVAALLLVAAMLPLAGALLSYNFNQAVTTAFDERLESLLNVVLASVEYEAGSDQLIVRRTLGDARFDRAFSGWYWQVTDSRGRTLTSRSLWDQRLPVLNNPSIDLRDIPGPRGQMLRRVEQDVQLPNLTDTLHVTVAADREELNVEVRHFSHLLWFFLIALGTILLTGLAVQTRWGLAPLRKIRSSLLAVEQGKLERLDTGLPLELRELANAINTVLERDRMLIERGRNAAGNLAHALKTPLSVMTTQVERLPASQRESLQRELERLDSAVRHHLARASAAGPVSLGVDARLNIVLAPVLDGIAKLAARRGLVFLPPQLGDLRARIDAQDLQEIIGNLLENAVEWAQGRIEMSCQATGSLIIFRIINDGPGMSPKDCSEAQKRGLRLDESRPGSGLGLTIAYDLVALYGGSLVLARANIGGLSAEVSLPKR